MTTIPARAIVAVTPSVLSAGGTGLDIIGLMLTDSTRIPIGTVQDFASQADVQAFFGLNSTEGALAGNYFAGYDNSFVKPSLLKMAQYNTADVSAWLRSGRITLTLAQLQALTTSTLTIPIDGVNIQAPSVDLSTATSFSNAAAIIEAAFADGTPQATAAGNTIAGTTLTLGGAITGTWAPGQTVLGAGVTAGTYIKSLISGTPNTDGATYLLSASSTVGSGEAMTGIVVPQVAFDSVSGAFTFTTVLAGSAETIGFVADNALAEALLLTQATGAVISQGASTATPATFMAGIVNVTQDWATFMTTFDPDNGSGNDNKYAFAEWNATQNNRWAYVVWDTDVSGSQQDPASSSLGYKIQQAQISGTFPIAGDGTSPVTAAYAAFECGYGASLDFTRTNGRATAAFRKQSGLVAVCSNQSAYDNLKANGYNTYGVFATANDAFIWMTPGSISGDFGWMDSYLDQIWMNNGLQEALMVLLQSYGSIPYNAAGYSLIEAACQDVINAAINFGAIRTGITLSLSQAAQVNSEAGLDISDVIQRQGYYLQVKDADPTTRQNRGSPPCTLWYTDGQSIQQINLASVEIA